MRSESLLIDEYLEAVEGQKFRLVIDTIYDDEAYSVDFLARVNYSDGRSLCAVSARATVYNPMDFWGAVTIASGVYGVCVAGGMIGAIGKVAFQSYDVSKKEAPNATRADRVRHVWKDTLGRKTELKAEAVKALTGCVAKFLGP